MCRIPFETTTTCYFNPREQKGPQVRPTSWVEINSMSNYAFRQWLTFTRGQTCTRKEKRRLHRIHGHLKKKNTFCEYKRSHLPVSPHVQAIWNQPKVMKVILCGRTFHFQEQLISQREQSWLPDLHLFYLLSLFPSLFHHHHHHHVYIFLSESCW